MERGPDAVPGEVAHYAVAEPAGIRLDHAADHVECAAGSHGLDPAHRGLPGPLDQQPRFLVHVAGEKGRVRVAVNAADVRGDVDIDNVTVGHNRVVRNAVADDLVQRCAERFRVTAVTKRARIGAVVDQELVADPVQFVGRHPGLDVPADLGQSLGRDPASDPHRRDGLGVLDIGLADLRVLLADVLRPPDLLGNLAHRRDPAGPQSGDHDLRV